MKVFLLLLFLSTKLFAGFVYPQNYSTSTLQSTGNGLLLNIQDYVSVLPGVKGDFDDFILPASGLALLTKDTGTNLNGRLNSKSINTQITSSDKGLITKSFLHVASTSGGYVDVKGTAAGELTIASTSGVVALASKQDSQIAALNSIDSKLTTGISVSGGATAALQTTLNTNVGAQADAAASSDTGSFSIISFIKRGMQNWTTLLASIPTLGQKLMSGSWPVTIASDQSALNVMLPDIFFTGQSAQTATVNNILTSTAGAAASDVAGYRSGSVQVVSTGTGGTFIFEGSNDNTNFQAITVQNQGTVVGSSINTAITASASQLIYTFAINYRYVRLRIATTITGGSIQAFSRFSQAPYSNTAMTVNQSTGANLIISGTVTATASGTYTTDAIVTNGTDIASAAVTTTAAEATQTQGNKSVVALFLNVTAVSGTNPTADWTLQESPDSGTTWFDTYMFPRMTTAGNYQTPLMRLFGNRYRLNRTVGGTTPSFTRAVISNRTSGLGAKLIRSFYNRTIDPNTLNSTTATWFIEGAREFTIYTDCTASTTPATLTLQISDDGAKWADTAHIITTQNGTLMVKNIIMTARFARLKTTTAGTGNTLNYVSIYGVD
jgi:hypothetical protein